MYVCMQAYKVTSGMSTQQTLVLCLMLIKI